MCRHKGILLIRGKRTEKACTKGEGRLDAVACAMINCGGECEEKKGDLKELHAALTPPGVVQGIISSRSCALRIYSGPGKSNFDRGRENNRAEPRERGPRIALKVQKARPSEEPLSSAAKVHVAFIICFISLPSSEEIRHVTSVSVLCRAKCGNVIPSVKVDPRKIERTN